MKDNNSIIFSTDDVEIYYDSEYKVRVRNKEKNENLIRAQEWVMKINNLPMKIKVRKNYGVEIGKIYQMAYNNEMQAAKDLSENLYQIIENNLITYKKIDFIIPVFIISVSTIMAASFCTKIGGVYNEAFIYGPLGALLGALINQKNIEIDYKVGYYVLFVEACKKVVIAILVAIIGSIAIKSKFIFASINFEENIYMEYLILILCGYSQTLVPSLLDKLGKDTK